MAGVTATFDIRRDALCFDHALHFSQAQLHGVDLTKRRPFVAHAKSFSHNWWWAKLALPTHLEITNVHVGNPLLAAKAVRRIQ